MLLNGHSLATADWFILDQLNSTRSFNYLMLPADIIGQVKVFKTPQADLEEGGIGGTVDVITRNPLDLDADDDLGLAAGRLLRARRRDRSAGVGALQLEERPSRPSACCVAGVYQKRTIRRDGVEVLGYFDADPSDTGELLAPSLIGSALFQQERERIGGNLAVQFQPNESLLVTLTGLYSKFDGDNVNQNFMAWGSRALANGGTLTNVDDPGRHGRRRHDRVAPQRDDRRARGLRRGLRRDRPHRLDATPRTSTSTSTWALERRWKLHFRAAAPRPTATPRRSRSSSSARRHRFTYDLRGKAPQVSYANIDPTDPTDLQFIFSSLHQILNDDSETYAYADAEAELGLGFLDSIKFGAKYTDHDRELRFNATTYGGFHVPINTLPASTFAGAMTPGDFLDAIKASGTLDRYWQVNRNEVERILFENLRNGPGRVLYPQQSFSIAEDVTGGYLMANLKGERWRGNVGVRYVAHRADLRTATWTSPTGAIENPYGNYDPISVDRNYDNWLPSLNFAFDFTDELVGRFAAARTMTRPDFTDIAPRASLNPGALTAQTGNPDLDPFEADQFDVSLEWYHGDDAAIVGALFYKDIKSFITDSVQTINFNINTASPPSLQCVEVGTDLWSCPFTTNVRSNGGGGKVQGFELADQPADRGRLRLQRELHLLRRRSRQRRPDPGQLREHVQRRGLLRDPAPERAARLYLPRRVLRHVRPLDRAEPGRLRPARRVGAVQHQREHRAHVRRAEPDRGRDRAVRGLEESGRARSTTTAACSTSACG